MENYDAIIIGSGMGSLTVACLLAQAGQKVGILEQNYLAGGCTSSYWRKGFVFESGATTLVGLDENMPLNYLIQKTGIKLFPRYLPLPMQVHIDHDTIINRYQDLDQWINEAERHFGNYNQARFWKLCYRISQFVWKTSTHQKSFPPSNVQDLVQITKQINLEQFKYAPYAFMSMRKLLEKFDLLKNKKFVQFIDEQLLITAQNTHQEVNVLFGATALCYTNYANYYVDGGLINLVNPLIQFIEKNEGKLHLRCPVSTIKKNNSKYTITCSLRGDKKLIFETNYVFSGIPINNLMELVGDRRLKKKYQKKIMPSEQLNGAFQMGIGFTSHKKIMCLHHQIHLSNPLPSINSNSIFVSFSHPQDESRCDHKSQAVASISTHIPDPESHNILDRKEIISEILNTLQSHDLIRQENIIYWHCSAPKAWEKWTHRKYGAVGGYPQYLNIKPWQMPDARADRNLYLCGDTVYPGQGIPGVTLSGIIAFEKWRKDHLS